MLENSVVTSHGGLKALVNVVVCGGIDYMKNKKKTKSCQNFNFV